MFCAPISTAMPHAIPQSKSSPPGPGRSPRRPTLVSAPPCRPWSRPPWRLLARWIFVQFRRCRVRARARFLDIDDDLWKRSYDLNVNGVFYAMQAALPHMLELGHPSTPRRRDMQ